jgi:molecular chaperone GrpE
MSQDPSEENIKQDASEEAQSTESEEHTESAQNEGSDSAANEQAPEASQENESETVPETIESLKEALKLAEEKVRDEALRAQAEIQNIRKRTERDVANAHKFGQEKLIKELLAVVDSLERGIQSVDEKGGELDETVKTIRDGSELTLKMFLDTLERFHVKVIDPLGEPFDPQFHEAMSMVENPDAEPNSVTAVVQKGFTLNERLVRPAMVMVVKG